MESRVHPRNTCRICVIHYDFDQRRPLVLPCGHSFCAKCISENIKGKRFLCRTCRKKHRAKDFPINYALENFYAESNRSAPVVQRSPPAPVAQCNPPAPVAQCNPPAPVEQAQAVASSSSSSEDEPRGLSKPMLAYKQEMIEKLLRAMATQQETCDRLHGYRQVLKAWEQEHREQLEYNLRAMQEHAEMQNRLEDEKVRMDKLLRELDELTARKEALEAEDNAALPSEKYKELCDIQKRVQNIQTNIRNQELIAKSDKLREESRMFQKLTLEAAEKVKNSPILTVSDLRTVSRTGSELVRTGMVFAVQRCEGEPRYAKITMNSDGMICLHALREALLRPQNPILIEHEELVRDFPPGLTFLELEAGGQPLGKIHIRLIPEGNFPLNFTRLCTGEDGPSYLYSQVISVYDSEGIEWISFGDYEYNNGSGGKAVVPGVNWDEEYDKESIYGNREWKLGAVAASGAGHGDMEDTASQFLILTQDNPDAKVSCYLGEVVEGFSVLYKAITSYPDIKKVTVKDCGIILSHS